MQDEARFLQRRQRRPVAFVKPLVAELVAGEGMAVSFQEDEPRAALPGRHPDYQVLSERNPYFQASLELLDVDPGAPLDCFEVRPPHLDEIGAALACVGSQRDGTCEVRGSSTLP